MKKQLFPGIQHTWYIDRLRDMFTSRPRCPTLFSTNHLLGACNTCGAGRFTRTKSRIQHLPLDRLYTVRVTGISDLQQLAWLIDRGQRVLTNLEFPIPRVKIATYNRLAKFYEPATNTIIDFLSASRNYRKVIRATDTLLAQHGFGYLVYEWNAKTRSATEYFRGAVSTADTQAAQRLIVAMRQFGGVK